MEQGNQTIVRAKSLTKQFGEGESAVWALRGADASFEGGSLSAIMGPSGSGKSTLMHILAGLDLPSSGEVYFSDTRIDTMSDSQLTALRRESIGFIFQSFNLIPVLDAQENILLPLTIRGSDPDKEWFTQLVRDFKIEDRLDHRPSELSGGQQQRVAIARALITKPKVIFADEPTGNLDSSTSKEVLGLLRRSVEMSNSTIIMVTHDPNAAAIADRVLFLEDGKIVGDHGRLSVEEILDKLKVQA